MSNSKTINFIILVTLITPLIALEFSWEFLRFDVLENRVDTYGEFYMDNCEDSDASMLMMFPFAVAEDLGKPDDVKAFSLTGKKVNW